MRSVAIFASSVFAFLANAGRVENHEESFESFQNVIEQYEFAWEAHSVTTEDGYILNMFRLVGPTPRSTRYQHTSRKVKEREKFYPDRIRELHEKQIQPEPEEEEEEYVDLSNDDHNEEQSSSEDYVDQMELNEVESAVEQDNEVLSEQDTVEKIPMIQPQLIKPEILRPSHLGQGLKPQKPKQQQGDLVKRFKFTPMSSPQAGEPQI